MEERQLQMRVGLFVVLALVVLGILIFINSEGWKSKYTLKLRTATAPGVTQNTPIRKNGILIGRVGTVRTEDDEVAVILLINSDETVYENEVVSIGTDSILGDAVLEIVPVGVDKRGEPLKPDDSIRYVSVKRNPLDIVDVAINLETKIAEALDTVKRAGASVEQAGNGLKNLTDQVSSAIGNQDSDFKQLLTNFQETNRKAQVALDNFNRIFEGINDVVGDEEIKNRFVDTVKKLPEIFNEIKTTVVDTRDTINSFRDVSTKVTRNLDNLEEFTVSLKDVGPEVLEKINSSLANVDELIRQINSFTDSIAKAQKGEGTVGKLLNDPSLYNNANETVAQVKALMIKLEPMINDLRMFSDALARNPGELGLQGVIRRKSWEAGYKGNTTGRDRTFREDRP